jgi:hypothetical protein
MDKLLKWMEWGLVFLAGAAIGSLVEAIYVTHYYYGGTKNKEHK